MGLSQSMQRLDDPFSDEEGSGYLGSPTRQSYRPHAFSSEYLPLIINIAIDLDINTLVDQVTAAQVEIYQTKNYAAESPTSPEEAACSAERQHHSAVGMDQMNSNRSLSPQGPQSWTSPSHSSSLQRAPDQARVHPGDHNLGESYKLQLALYLFIIISISYIYR